VIAVAGIDSIVHRGIDDQAPEAAEILRSVSDRHAGSDVVAYVRHSGAVVGRPNQSAYNIAPVGAAVAAVRNPDRHQSTAPGDTDPVAGCGGDYAGNGRPVVVDVTGIVNVRGTSHCIYPGQQTVSQVRMRAVDARVQNGDRYFLSA